MDAFDGYDGWALLIFLTFKAFIHYQLGRGTVTSVVELLNITNWRRPSITDVSFMLTSVCTCVYLSQLTANILLTSNSTAAVAAATEGATTTEVPPPPPTTTPVFSGVQVMADTYYTRGAIACTWFWLEALIHFNIGRNSSHGHESTNESFDEEEEYDAEQEAAFEKEEEEETGDGVMPDNVPLLVSPPAVKNRSSKKNKRSTSRKKTVSIKKEKKVQKKVKKNVKYSRTTTLVENLRHPEDDKDVSLFLRPRHRGGGTVSTGSRASSTRSSSRLRKRPQRYVVQN